MYQLSVWLHILMAAIWVGGLIYTASVAVPFAVSRGGEDRQRILRGLGRRFRIIGWGAIVVLFLTGLGNLSFRYSPISLGQLMSGDAFDPEKVDRFIAIWLPWKLMLVAVMIALMLYHDITSTRAARSHQGAADAAPGNRGGTTAAALATLVAIAVLYVSVRLVRG
jgi:copper resistance protein D